MTTSDDPQVINVQPHPRLLSVLGDIEFAPWQCLAELIDNAFDEFVRQASASQPEVATEPIGDAAPIPTVTISLPSRRSDPRDAEVWVQDNGPGMSLEQLNSAMRAGWSSNDRHGQLGLYGVGFNIATARLGHVAVVKTARKHDPVWTVVTLDLRALARSNSYTLPVTSEPKTSPTDHGTQVVVRDLKPEHRDSLSRQQAKIRETLGDVYSYLLADRGFQLIVDRQLVKPRRPCLWSEERAVVRGTDRIPAVIHIDKQLADRHVCLDCGLWQENLDDTCESCSSRRLEIRPRRIWGWLGIQRYLHATDYGIDFIRNGRKILLRDVSMFQWRDPNEPGARGEVEYPIELPRAGRIVGQIHVDHVRVNYQKNAFEYDTPEWKTVEVELRGRGPLGPKRAVAAGYPINDSHLARLLAGYRRTEAGLKYLIPGDGKVALNDRAKEWAERFRAGDPDYQSDEQWFRAATQHDERRRNGLHQGDVPDLEVGTSGDVPNILERKGLLDPPQPSEVPISPPPPSETEEDRRKRWRANGQRQPDLEARFGLPGEGAALDVTAYLVHGHHLRRQDDPGRVPVYVAAGKGSSVEVFIDADHDIFSEFAVETRDLVVIEIADYLRLRSGSHRALSAIFADLKARCMPDHRLNSAILGDEAARLLAQIREAMQTVITGNASGYWSLMPGEDQNAAERRYAMEGGSATWDEVIDSGDWVAFAPALALAKLLGSRPEAFLDRRVFRSSYASLKDLEARKAAVERVVDLFGDVAVLGDRPFKRGTEELQRGRLSCTLLARELVSPEDGAA